MLVFCPKLIYNLNTLPGTLKVAKIRHASVQSKTIVLVYCVKATYNLLVICYLEKLKLAKIKQIWLTFKTLVILVFCPKLPTI